MINIPLKKIELTTPAGKVIVKGGTLSIERHFVETTTTDSGGFAEYMPTQSTWRISLNEALPNTASSGGLLHFSSGAYSGDCIAEGQYLLKQMGTLTTK